MANQKKVCPVLLCLLFLTLSGFSQEQKFNFWAGAGYSIPQSENINSGFESGFGLAIPLSRKISFSLDFSHWKSDVNEEAGKLMAGKLSVNPFLISLHISLFQRKAFTPFIFLGGGIIFTSFRLNEFISIPEITIKQKIENGIGLYGGTGGILNLSKNFSLFSEIGYIYRKATGITTTIDLNFGKTTKEFSLNLNSLFLRLGIKYFL